MNNSKLYYTGIGSRETPTNILALMSDISIKLEKKGYILRSGGADGADKAFELGAKTKEIYLPWKDFNGNKSEHYLISEDAFRLAKEIHPKYDYLSYGTKKLHARNTYQVLGKDLKTPSKFVICWTPNGEEIGGTATAIRLAKKHNIPVFNLFHFEAYNELLNTLENQ